VQISKCQTPFSLFIDFQNAILTWSESARSQLHFIVLSAEELGVQRGSN